jgi:hypothetical protein
MLSGNLTYLEDESTNETAVFYIELIKPQKPEFEDINIKVLDSGGVEIKDFTYNFTDINMNNRFDTGDKLNITLDDGEWVGGEKVILTIIDYSGTISITIIK